ncbi:MAG: FKBP-type peptidyl-prolyl cis-trans isomerase [Bacteroidales bacterium]|nr:FKBP-type peptidyl-prolyl cis-trans isomerase [Bacteroidales bacterium]
MKNTFKYLTMLVAGVILFAACNKSDIPGYKKTKSGLHYKIEKVNKKGEKLVIGDQLVAEVVFRLDNEELFSNVGKPQRMFTIKEDTYHGDGRLDEGLLMLHVGDKASFAIFADSMAAYYDNHMPPSYLPGKGQILYYDVTVVDRVSADELNQERENFYENMKQMEEAEPAAIAEYVKKNNITTAPRANGLYVIVRKQGKGNVVATGKDVSLKYKGSLLDGRVFDSNTLQYTVGKMGLIPGWEEGIDGMPAGTELTLIIPSKLGYGPMGNRDVIPPYSPLVFDIEITQVK